MRLKALLWVLFGAVVGFLTIAAAFLFIQKPVQFNGTVFEPAYPAADFSLQRSNGEVYQISEQLDRVVLLFFGYTHCPDVCPVTLNDFRTIQELLGVDADQVEFVMVTVDPERDTPEVVEDYVHRFNPSFIGLSGSEAELDPVWKGYFVYRAIVNPESQTEASEGQTQTSDGGYLVDHTARVYVVDKAGNLRISYPFATGAEAIASDVRQLLRE